MANGQDGFGAKWEKGELGKGEVALGEMGKKLGEIGMGEMALGEMGINLDTTVLRGLSRGVLTHGKPRMCSQAFTLLLATACHTGEFDPSVVLLKPNITDLCDPPAQNHAKVALLITE
jgi:hypothetical protein